MSLRQHGDTLARPGMLDFTVDVRAFLVGG